MKLKSHLFSIGAMLSMAGTAMAGPVPISAGPYLVYQGTLSQSSTISETEGTAVAQKITTNSVKFHRLNATLQKDINAYVSKDGGASETVIYLIVDERNTANYTFVLLDPTQTGVRIPSIVSANLSPEAATENFLSGFALASKGLGAFRLGVSHSVGTDPSTGNPASILLQGYGTGELVTTAHAQIAPAQRAESFFTVVNGHKQGTVHHVPAFPAILSTTGAAYMPTITGPVLGYYFDDSASQSLAGASTKGTFMLTINPMLTQLANNGGGYEPNVRNVGLVSPISASNTTAFKAWVKSLISIAVPTP